MHFTSFIFGFGLLAASLAHPTVDKRDDDGHVTVANLTFHGGPVSYSMVVPADGNVYPTSKRSYTRILNVKR